MLTLKEKGLYSKTAYTSKSLTCAKQITSKNKMSTIKLAKYAS